MIVEVSSCFSEEMRVQLVEGEYKKMKDLETGDKFYNYEEKDGEGEEKFEDEITGWLDRDEQRVGKFYEIKLADARIIQLSEYHLININGHYQYANRASINDIIHGSHVKEISLVFSKGVYSPLSKSGTIIVNHIRASVYSNLESHSIAHQWFRLYHSLSPLISLPLFVRLSKFLFSFIPLF